MSSKFNKFRQIMLGTCLGLLAGHPVLADDTEIFTGQTLDAGQPNVLFIIDTSGSMGGLVDWTIPYDVATPYSGDCNNDRLYFAESNQGLPDCNGDDWFEDYAFICEQGQPTLNSEGYYTDKLIQFEDDNKPDKRQWDAPRDNQQDWPVECFADNGLHGDGANDIEVYAADKESAPFSIDPNDPNNYDWIDAKEYTVYSGNYINYISNPANYEITRLDVVKTVAGDTLSEVSGLNVGMMRFDRGGDGGMVSRALAPIASELGPMTTKLNSYKDGGNTPLSETLYESALYF
ncbi:MAG: hypothetical protein KJO35_08140, partial [Gammaproteobacteria bacterium]|nr:hypothetical protein [Gammaproteobacteria bacterium]